MIFRLVIVFVHLWSLAFASVLSEPPLFQSLGLGSRLRVYRARSPSHPTESSSLPGPREPYVTDWHFAFSCSPRSDYAAAVSCRYSRSDSRLTGTSTPLRCHLHSRTLSSLRDTKAARLSNPSGIGAGALRSDVQVFLNSATKAFIDALASPKSIRQFSL